MAQSSLYGGTFGALTHDFTDLGIQHTLVSAQDPAAWAVALRPETRVFYAEAITNPLLEVGLGANRERPCAAHDRCRTGVCFRRVQCGRLDAVTCHVFMKAAIPRAGRMSKNAVSQILICHTAALAQIADHKAIVAFAREHKLVSIIDNTFASPVNFRPLEIGYDIVLESATKYLGGHSDLIAGVYLGSREHVKKVGTLNPEPQPHLSFSRCKKAVSGALAELLTSAGRSSSMDTQVAVWSPYPEWAPENYLQVSDHRCPLCACARLLRHMQSEVRYQSSVARADHEQAEPPGRHTGPALRLPAAAVDQDARRARAAAECQRAGAGHVPGAAAAGEGSGLSVRAGTQTRDSNPGPGNVPGASAAGERVPG